MLARVQVHVKYPHGYMSSRPLWAESDLDAIEKTLELMSHIEQEPVFIKVKNFGDLQWRIYRRLMGKWIAEDAIIKA